MDEKFTTQLSPKRIFLKIFNLSFLFRLTNESYSEEKKIIKEKPGKIIGSGLSLQVALVG
jgi:hypothetical protein